MAGTDGAAEHIFTTADAAAMPNTDRLTHKEFWRIMEDKCPVLHGETAKPIDITRAYETLPWHLWLATCMSGRHALQAHEVRHIMVLENTPTRKRFALFRADSTVSTGANSVLTMSYNGSADKIILRWGRLGPSSQAPG